MFPISMTKACPYHTQSRYYENITQATPPVVLPVLLQIL